MRRIVVAVTTLAAMAGPASAATQPDSARVIVKLSSAVAEAPDILARQGRSTRAISADFDRLGRRYGLRRSRPLRTGDASILSVAGRRAREAQRRARFPRLVHPAAPLPSFASTYVLELAPGTDAEEAARAFAALDIVVYAEPDRVRELLSLPNDPFLSTSGSWGQDFDDLWGLDLISAPAAWDVSRGAGIVIAISDTGIDITHPDLAANIWVNPGEIPGNGIDDDGNGYVDDIHGWNSVNESPDVFDDHGHGSHVAGTAAAVGNNGIGIVGVAYESRLMAVKGLSASGYGLDSSLAEGILYAVDNGARVINASWGGGLASQTLNDAIETAHAAGVVFVVAAGNENQDTDDAYPANLRSSLAVSAFDHVDQRASFSNYGVKIDVAAPGGGDSEPASIFEPQRSILSVRSSGAGTEMTGGGGLVVGGSYLRQAGTSMAAPHVSGAAAVVLSAHPEYSVEQVRQALRQGADDVGAPGFDIDSGYGRLNVAGALAVDALEAHIASPQSGVPTGAHNLTLTGSARGPGFVSYRVEYATAADPTSWIPLTGPVFSEVTDGGLLADVDISSWVDGVYFIRLLVEQASGAVFQDRIRLVLNRVFLTAPSDETIFHGGEVIELRGTIAPSDLINYTLEYRVSPRPADPSDLPSDGTWSDAGVALTGGGLSPVYDGVLATLDTSVFTESTRLTLTFTIAKASGTTTRSIIGVIVDPSLKAGWPVRLSEGNVWLAMTSAPTIVDLDGDGQLEVLATYYDHVYAFRPDGTDLPGWPALIEKDPLETSIVSLAKSGPSVGDVDGDGDLEVVTTRGQLLHVFDRDGAYLPGWPRRFDNLFGADCALADLDGDGALEIIFRTAARFPNDSYAAIHAVRADGSEIPGFPTNPAAAYGQGCCYAGDAHGYGHSLSVGDIDGDGSPDILATWIAPAGPRFGGRTLRLFAIDAHGQLKRRFPKALGKYPFPYAAYGPSAGPVLADLNGDHVLDIAIGKHGNLKKVYAWDGWGRRIRVKYKLPRYKAYRARDRYDPLIAADITGDGTPELFLPTNLQTKLCSVCNPPLRYDYLVAVTPGLHPSGLLPGWPKQFAFRTAEKAHGAGTPVVGDIDGDGDPEIVVGFGGCRPASHINCTAVWAFETDGSVVPGFPKQTLGPNVSALSSPAIADLDGDGITEVVFIDTLARLMVYEVPGTPGPRSFPWPMARQNPAHTNALPVAP